MARALELPMAKATFYRRGLIASPMGRVGAIGSDRSSEISDGFSEVSDLKVIA
jgi:hypothetical protein